MLSDLSANKQQSCNQLGIMTRKYVGQKCTYKSNQRAFKAKKKCNIFVQTTNKQATKQTNKQTDAKKTEYAVL